MTETIYSFRQPQSLDVDLAEREPLLDDLRTAARPLIDTCDAQTAQQIDAAVRQAEADWAETRDNLQELCTKYQRAADVWRRYRDASDAVKQWADEQMSQLGALQPLDAAKQVEVSVSHAADYLWQSVLFARTACTCWHTSRIYLERRSSAERMRDGQILVIYFHTIGERVWLLLWMNDLNTNV